jgi:hypothetical protein
MTGPGRTSKSSTIREFTSKHLKYEKTEGDILGIFPMPWRKYAIGISGSGDNLNFILKGQRFLTRYDGLEAMIVASRSDPSSTLEEVRRFAKSVKADLHEIETTRLVSPGDRVAVIKANVARIKRLLPR